MGFNTARPLTQFDEAPERGTTACTYISGVTAIRSLTRQEFATNPSEWADCILRGVVAFHAAARSNTHLKGYSHIEEALPYVMEVLGYTPSDANRFIVKEKICLLYHVEVLEGKTPSMVLGNGYVDEVGKRGLIPLLRDVLNKSSALVITRPPETWSVTLKGEEKKSRTVHFRDSHRKLQFDFENIDSFLSWVSMDRAFFASVPSSGIDFNSVSITWFVEKNEEEILMDLQKEKEEMEMEKLDADIKEKRDREKYEEEFLFLDGGSKTAPLTSAKSLPLSDDFSHLSSSGNLLSLSPDSRNRSIKKSHSTRPATAPNSSSPKSPKTSIQQNNGERPIQVEDRVFIGGRQIAQNKTVLLTYGITHVLNAAPSMCDNYHQSDRSFTYKSVRIYEKQNNNATFRGTASDFISQALSKNATNRIFVHCESGISVSPTIVMAWMMVRKHQTLSTAYTHVINNKSDACPSENMFQELLRLEKRLYKTNTMDASERSTDIIMDVKNGILANFGLKRDKVLTYVKKNGVVEAQRRLLEEVM